MKPNYFLRTAVYLLVAVVASMSLLGSAGAKYVASATIEASARVAKFAFVTNSTPFGAQGDGGANKQFVVAPGESASNVFTFPLFDTVYYAPVGGPLDNYFYSPDPTMETVESSNGDLVAAPGTGINFGPGKNNTADFTGHNGYFKLQFRNDSEVAVRYRLSVNSSAPLKGVPLYLFGPARLTAWAPASTGLVLSGNASTEWNTLGPMNGSYDIINLAWFWMFNQYGTGYAVPDEGQTDPPPNGTALISTINSLGWVANSDADDSYLGWLGAEHLRGNIGRDAASMKLELKLEVEQID